MTIVSNTSPIVLLAKVNKLRVLKEMYGEIVLPPAVKIESVDRGKDLGAKDTIEIENGIQDGWIKLTNLSREQNQKAARLVEETKIGIGEAEALVLARDLKIPIILDDKEARALADNWGVSCMGTVMVLYTAFVRGLLSYDDLVNDLNALTRIMWISTDVVTEIIKRAKSVKNDENDNERG